MGNPCGVLCRAASGPRILSYDHNGEFDCVCPNGENTHHSCEERSQIWGTAGFVTGAFGLACASVVVRTICEAPRPWGVSQFTMAETHPIVDGIGGAGPMEGDLRHRLRMGLLPIDTQSDIQTDRDSFRPLKSSIAR